MPELTERLKSLCVAVGIPPSDTVIDHLKRILFPRDRGRSEADEDSVVLGKKLIIAMIALMAYDVERQFPLERYVEYVVRPSNLWAIAHELGIPALYSEAAPLGDRQEQTRYSEAVCGIIAALVISGQGSAAENLVRTRVMSSRPPGNYEMKPPKGEISLVSLARTIGDKYGAPLEVHMEILALPREKPYFTVDLYKNGTHLGGDSHELRKIAEDGAVRDAASKMMATSAGCTCGCRN